MDFEQLVDHVFRCGIMRHHNPAPIAHSPVRSVSKSVQRQAHELEFCPYSTIPTHCAACVGEPKSPRALRQGFSLPLEHFKPNRQMTLRDALPRVFPDQPRQRARYPN